MNPSLHHHDVEEAQQRRRSSLVQEIRKVVSSSNFLGFQSGGVSGTAPGASNMDPENHTHHQPSGMASSANATASGAPATGGGARPRVEAPPLSRGLPLHKQQQQQQAEIKLIHP